MASVHERVSARTGAVTWRVMFRVGTTQRQETFLDPESAYAFKRNVDLIGGAAAMRVKAAKQAADTDMPTLRQFTARYLDATSGLLTGVEPGTRKGYERAANLSFLHILGDHPVDSIDKEDVGRWLAWQEVQPAMRGRGRPVAAKTVKNYHSILSSVLSAAVEKGYRADNPAYKTRLSKGVKREAVFLSPDEFATLLHFVADHYQPLVLFLASTGTRWGEATAVTWGDINARVNPVSVRIDKAWKKSETNVPVLKHPKSQRANRTISIPSDAVAAMGDRGAASELAFSTRDLKRRVRYQTFRARVWLPAVAKAMDVDLCEREGLVPLTRRPTPHDLRHSHASWLIAAGTPLPYVQARLGHESIQTTVNVYGHLVPDAHIQMADVIGGTLANVRPLKQLT
ncbi:site-specific integrase [Microbacterium jejuense]|uniref:tyrosine-type recombinase/integrase n=1 Tax=Microbacterium jejuense TaxID=1263637 RepID=UPI0031EA2AA2